MALSDDTKAIIDAISRSSALGGGGGGRGRRDAGYGEGTGGRSVRLGPLDKEVQSLSKLMNSYSMGIGNSSIVFKQFSENLEKASNALLDKVVKGLYDTADSMKTGNKVAAVFANELKNGGLSAREASDRIAAMSNASELAADNITSISSTSATFDDAMKTFTGSITAADPAIQNLLSAADDLSFGLEKTDADIVNRIKNMTPGDIVTPADYQQLAKALDKVRLEAKGLATGLEASAAKTVRFAGAQEGATKGFLKLTGATEFKLVPMFLAAAAGAAKMVDEYRTVMTAGLGGHFANIAGSALRLGISTQKLTEVLTNNAVLVASLGGAGPSKFIASLQHGQKRLELFGLRAEDAAEGASGIAKNLGDMGYNLQNTDDFNKAMTKQTESFRKLQITTGATIQQFNALQSELISNAEVQAQTLAMAPAERAARIDELTKVRQTATQFGMTDKAAQELAIRMQAVSKSTVKDRFKAMSQIMAAGGAMGMSGQASELAKLMNKKNKSKDENIRQAELYGQFEKKIQQMEASGDYGGAEILGNMIREMLESSGINAAALKSGGELERAKQDKIQIKDKDLAARMLQSRENPLVQATLGGFDILKNALTSPLSITAAATAGMFALMLKQNFPALIGKFTSSITSIFSPLKTIFSGFGGIGGSVGGGLAHMFKTLGTFGKMAATGLGKLFAPLGAIISVFTTLFTWGERFGEISSELTGVFGIFKIALGGVVDMVIQFLKSFGDMFDWFGSLFGGKTDVGGWIGKLGDSAVKGILNWGKEEKKGEIATPSGSTSQSGVVATPENVTSAAKEVVTAAAKESNNQNINNQTVKNVAAAAKEEAKSQDATLQEVIETLQKQTETIVQTLKGLNNRQTLLARS